MKWVMCLVLAFGLWLLLSWSVDLVALGTDRDKTDRHTDQFLDAL